MDTNVQRLVSTISYSTLKRLDCLAADDFIASFREPDDQTVESQIRAANHYWRMILGRTSCPSSIRARELLIECELQQWLEMFAKEVAPRIVALRAG